MGWTSEIFRKKHRLCARCRLGPVHMYGAAGGGTAGPAPDASGQTPLCTTCLGEQLEQDFSGFPARALLFEPILGPDALVFHPLDRRPATAWPPERLMAARAALDRLEESCRDCARPGRFLWVPVDRDANLWSEHWLEQLRAGTLTPSATLCGPCAARLLSDSIQERGLFFETIVAPRDTDGVIFGTEA